MTGSWNPDTQRWDVEGQFRLLKGKNFVRLFAEHPFPHIDKLLFVKRNSPVQNDANARATNGDATQRPALNKQFVTQWSTYLGKDAGSESSLWPAFHGTNSTS